LTRIGEGRVVTNNRYAIYLGCMCLLIGGAGLAYKSVSDRSPASAQADATPATVGAGGQQAQWPPANSSVAFHNEMVELLSPATTEGTAARPQQQRQAAPPQQQAAPATPPQQSAPTPQQQFAPPQNGQQAAAPPPQQQAAPRERIREAAPEPRNSRNARRERERTPEPAPDDTAGTVGRSAGPVGRVERSEPTGNERDGRREIRGRNGTRVIIERDGSRTVVDRRGRIIQERGQPSRDEVDIVGRDGRRYRIDRGDRAEQDDSPPEPRRYRRIEPERPPPPEYRGPDRPIPGLFGIFGGNW
jgi:hypothetical protein